MNCKTVSDRRARFGYYQALWTTFLGLLLASCTVVSADPLPTRAALATIPTPSITPTRVLPPTATSPMVDLPGDDPPEPTLTPAPTLTPTNTPEPIIHQVEPGETSLSIAFRFGISLEALMLANGITNPDLLQVGQQLQIPPDTPAAEDKLPVYYVQAGDTFSSIAHKFNISVELLQQANPNVQPEALSIGQAIGLPLDGLHVVGWGETLSQIAARYQVSLDNLFAENKTQLDPNNPNFVQAGSILVIPSAQAVAGYDCSPQPPRLGVIEYVVQPDEKLLCLQEKFGVSMTTILYANFARVSGEGALAAGTTLLIPPGDGALYTATADDIANSATLEDLVRWYGIRRFDDIVDWQGNPVPLPLSEGQQLFIPGADLLAGAFQSSTLVHFQPEPTPSGDTIAGPPPAPGSGAPARPPGVEYIPPAAGAAPPGALSRSYRDVWDGANPYDVGYCPPADGSGWTNDIAWPAAGHTIWEGGIFRPGHPAVDIIGATGDPVYAAESGVVAWAGFSSWGGGNIIVLAHGNGWRTYYAHLDQVMVACGQAVSKGSVVGQIGQTGTGWPHLHFEVQNGAHNYDPLRWLSGATFGPGPDTSFSRPEGGRP